MNKKRIHSNTLNTIKKGVVTMNSDNSISKKYSHLSIEERYELQIYCNDGLNISQIAKKLSRNKSTISRELSRNSVVQKDTQLREHMCYFADTAQNHYTKRRKNCGTKLKLEPCMDCISWVENKIKDDKWSPDAAIGEFKKLFPDKPCVTTKTFYNYIDLRLVDVKPIDLLLKVKLRQHSKHVKKHKKVLGDSIEIRPESINSREEIGHWEIDSVIGVRATRMEIIVKTPGKKSIYVQEAFMNLRQKYGESFNKVFKSITCDNGSEFSFDEDFKAKLGVNFYYAHPYSSYERGTNENHNGIIRRFIPKGKSIDDIPKESVERICNWMNTLPRKILNYNTPLELFSKYMLSL